MGSVPRDQGLLSQYEMLFGMKEFRKAGVLLEAVVILGHPSFSNESVRSVPRCSCRRARKQYIYRYVLPAVAG